MNSRGRIEKLRTDKACRSCRRRKVRCDMNGNNGCRACERRSSPCIPASPKKKTATRNRDLLAGLPSLEPQDGVDESFQNIAPLSLDLPVFEEPFAPSAVHFDLPPYSGRIVDETLSNPDPLSSLSCFTLPRSLVNDPRSQPFSVFSSAGDQWLQDAVGDEPLDCNLMLPSSIGPDLTDADFHSSLRRQFIALPPKDEARRLLKTYFESVNPFVPTFEEHEVMLHFEQDYPILPESSAEKWACLNATLAVASLLDPDSCSKAWLYWKNATMSWGAFFTHTPSLLSVQALITMTVYLIGTFHNNLSSTMVPMAVRTLHGLSPAEMSISRQARMVLMITRALDIDYALQVGASPACLSLGEADDTDFPSLPLFDFFDAFCGLIRLKEDIYRALYSLSAQDKSDSEVISCVGELDARLEEWKANIPAEYRPGHPDAAHTIKRGNCALVVNLQLCYYNSLLTIHRRTIPCTSALSMQLDSVKSSNLTFRSPNPRSLVSERLCTEAARSSLKLVKHIPQDNPLISGVMVHYLVFALKLLVILIVQDARSPRAQADIILLRKMEDVLSSICESRKDQSIIKLIEYCVQYRQVAEKAVKQALPKTVR
ncbi:hypothetical protein BDV19DRAFT_178374 [Aspergillus venezuelensis]